MRFFLKFQGLGSVFRGLVTHCDRLKEPSQKPEHHAEMHEWESDLGSVYVTRDMQCCDDW